jgi:hypothetical protein
MKRIAAFNVGVLISSARKAREESVRVVRQLHHKNYR